MMHASHQRHHALEFKWGLCGDIIQPCRSGCCLSSSGCQQSAQQRTRYDNVIGKSTSSMWNSWGLLSYDFNNIALNGSSSRSLKCRYSLDKISQQQNIWWWERCQRSVAPNRFDHKKTRPVDERLQSKSSTSGCWICTFTSMPANSYSWTNFTGSHCELLSRSFLLIRSQHWGIPKSHLVFSNTIEESHV